MILIVRIMCEGKSQKVAISALAILPPLSSHDWAYYQFVFPRSKIKGANHAQLLHYPDRPHLIISNFWPLAGQTGRNSMQNQESRRNYEMHISGVANLPWRSMERPAESFASSLLKRAEWRESRQWVESGQTWKGREGGEITETKETGSSDCLFKYSSSLFAPLPIDRSISTYRIAKYSPFLILWLVHSVFMINSKISIFFECNRAFIQ